MLKDYPLNGVLLATDLDGTLVTSDFEIPERNIGAVERFKANGGLFTFATGRGPAGCKRFARRLPPNVPAIVLNGSALCDLNSGNVVWSRDLSDSAPVYAGEMKKRFPDVGIEIFKGADVYIMNENKYTKWHMTSQNIKSRSIPEGNMISHGQKMIFTAGPDRIAEAAEFFKDNYGGEFHCVYSSKIFFEVLPVGVSKAEAFKRLAKILEIDYNNTVGIGDYYNDAELVGEAAFGAAVGGSPEEIRKLADFVTGDCSGGAVADLIEYLERHRLRGCQ